MPRFGRTCFHAAVMALAASLGVMVYESSARQDQAPPAPPAPTAVATVDLERVFAALDIATEAAAAVTELAEKLDAERKAKVASVRKLEEDLAVFPEDSAEGREIQKRVVNELADYEAFNAYAQGKLDREAGEAFRVTYAEIKSHVKTFAQAHGYGLVLLDDSVRDIEPAGQNHTIAQISAQKVLYADDTIDVTDALIQWMNRK